MSWVARLEAHVNADEMALSLTGVVANGSPELAGAKLALAAAAGPLEAGQQYFLRSGYRFQREQSAGGLHRQS